MSQLLDRPMRTSRKHFMTFIRPPEPVMVPAIERPSFEVLQATFSWIDYIGPDSSVTLPCSFYLGMPIIGEKTRKGGRAISQVIDDYFRLFQPPLLGIQHAWEFCRNQREIPFLSLRGIQRIWFYSLCAYEEPSGGEFRPTITRRSNAGPWFTQMVPTCDYHPQADCLALAQL